MLISFKYVERVDPPGHYKVQVEGPGGAPSFEAPRSYQPVGVLPQDVSYALTFVIA